MYKLAIVVPCYKEEEVLEICSEALRGVLNDLAAKGKITTAEYEEITGLEYPADGEVSAEEALSEIQEVME